MLTTLVPADGTVLMLINGAYGLRAKKILDIARRGVIVHETPEDTPPDLAAVERILAATPQITHIFAVHCETTSGILNPIRDIARWRRSTQRVFLLDSMSAFGALPLDAQALSVDAIAASSNKCIEGVPGLGFVFAAGRARADRRQRPPRSCSICMNQWKNFERTGQYRFTPPIHVIVSFHQALTEFFAEGGQSGRGKR